MVAKPPQEAVAEIGGQHQVLAVVRDSPAFTVGVEQAVGLVAGALASDELRPGGGLSQPGGLQGLERGMGGIKQHCGRRAVRRLQPEANHDRWRGSARHLQTPRRGSMVACQLERRPWDGGYSAGMTVPHCQQLTPQGTWILVA